MTPTLVLDVDGVLTDGTKLYDATGSCIAKSFADIDFTAQKKFKEAGWNVCWLSADTNINQAIAKARDIDFFSSREPDGRIDKIKALHVVAKHYNIVPSNVVYVGDDLYDVPLMRHVYECGGEIYCPQNSSPGVKSLMQGRNHVLNSVGGAGAIMELYCRLTGDHSGEPPLCG